ncbi:MBL fold metallo-hydrolase [Sphingobium sp. SJ10-10]|uniref:MBL fold metallo-hydrolase n=1 Tax=Sphingobium sp. SJ10-10 TaxID=3114999 RepID=UPI002E17C697|nr:MBL fold metallo-hydrolase [Sphingobium sp. SJ10-10]
MAVRLTPLLAAAGLSLLGTAASAENVRQIDYYRATLGEMRITVISDGTAFRDTVKLVTRLDAKLVAKMLHDAYREQPTELSINAFLIETGGKRILIDTGAGDLFKPRDGGRLIENLKAAGFSPDDIDAVLITHIHADHTGGLMFNGKKVFTRSKIYIPEADYAFWMDEDAAKRAVEPLKHVYDQARTCIGPYIPTGQIRTFAWGEQLFPGITALKGAGHTPGHSYFALESGGQKMLMVGDTVHVAEVQFARPDASVQFDVDQKAAAEQRKALFDDAARRGYWLAFDHVSFPGIGHVRADGDGYAWIPIPYGVNDPKR